MKADLKKLFDRFSYDFNRIFAYMSGNQQRELAYLAPTLFVRWYYSAIFPETVLSPSTVSESRKDSIVPGKGFYGYCARIKNTTGGMVDFVFRKNLYSIDEHPIYKDLNMLMGYISPALHVNGDLTLKEKDIRALQRKATISDRYYVIYLFNLADRLGLYKEMPSIYEKCIQPNQTVIFFDMEPEKRFNMIIDCSCEMCADEINKEIEFPLCDFGMLRGFVEKPVSLDDIFTEIYAKSGFSIYDLWDKAKNGSLDSVDSAVIASIPYIGAIIDKMFIFVFGHYLRLIRPIYSFPINFREVINSLFNAIAMDGERDMEIFSPCTAYSHTHLGKLLFGKNKKPDILCSAGTIEKITELLDEKQNIEEEEYTPVFLLKAVFDDDRKLWKKVELEEETPLCIAIGYLMMMFLLPPDTKYSLKIKREGPEKYIPFEDLELLVNPRAILADLFYEKNSTLLFCFENGRKIELCVIDEHIGYQEIIYPRILEQSREITELEHEMYDFD